MACPLQAGAMYAPPLSVPEAIRLIAERLALAGHPRTPEDDLAEMGDQLFDLPRRTICELAVAMRRCSPFGAPTPSGVYARAEIELARAIKVGDITLTNDLIRRSDINRLWPPTVADAIPMAVAAGDPAPHVASHIKERRDNALRELITKGTIDRSTPRKKLQGLVFKKLGITAETAPKGFSEDTLDRHRKNLTH
jgi:hypothetical protein